MSVREKSRENENLPAAVIFLMYFPQAAMNRSASRFLMKTLTRSRLLIWRHSVPQPSLKKYIFRLDGNFLSPKISEERSPAAS
jgi:hypothetical protein